MGQGRDNVKEYFKENQELAKEIENKVFENTDKLYSKQALNKAAAPKAVVAEKKDETVSQPKKVKQT